MLVGCAVGLLFLLVGGSSEWKLPFALAVTVLVSSYVIHIQTMWRQAPITAAIVIAAGLTHHSKLSGHRARPAQGRRGAARAASWDWRELDDVPPLAHVRGGGQGDIAPSHLVCRYAGFGAMNTSNVSAAGPGLRTAWL